MQSGHGKVYMDSFGLFISIPFVSLCVLILSKCLFNDFHLHINGNSDFSDLQFDSMIIEPKLKQKTLWVKSTIIPDAWIIKEYGKPSFVRFNCF